LCKKVTQNVAQRIFAKIKTSLFPWTKIVQMSCSQIKNVQYKQSANGRKFAPNPVTLLTSAVAVEFPFSSFRFSIFRQTAGYPPTYLLNDFYLPIGGVIFVGNIAIIPTHG
jgi:antirestriction protein ArdC